MPVRRVDIDGASWEVRPAGRVTPYVRDEFSILFLRDGPDGSEVRTTRYSPHGARWREQSFAELSDDDLRRLFGQSQPSSTSPEAGYLR